MNIFKKTTLNLIALAVILGSFGGLIYLSEGKKSEASFFAVQAPATTLFSGIASNSTSARLRSFNDIYGNKLTMTNFGAIGYVTFEPGVTGKEEIVSFTGITDNGDGTQTITGLTRGLIGKGPTYGSGGTARPHGSNTYVVVSNTGEFYNQFAIKQNNESITGLWNFNSLLPTSNLVATTSTQFVTKALLDGTVAAGVATSSELNFGGVWLGTALQQASSTNGGANQPFVMQTRYATDTPLSGCAVGYTGTAGAGCSVIATLAGKIKQTWLDIFTTVNTWTGTNTFTATTTHNGQSVFNSTSTFNGVVIGISDVQTFLASSTWYKPAQTSSSSIVTVECWGAGGGGGGVNTGGAISGAGGGGAYFFKDFISSSLTATVTVTIGSGGAGGAAGGNNNGVAGGNSTFGSYLTSYGGGGGGYGAANAGSGGGGGGALGAGGSGSSGSGVSGGGGPGAITTGGQEGWAGGYGGAYNSSGCGGSAYGGGGGGSGGLGCSSLYGGAGGQGASLFGGNGGARGTAVCGSTIPGANGGNGSVPGGGGGATCHDGVTTLFSGGNGANGKCIVTTHI